MLETAEQWHQQGQKVALLTLVGVKGSAYRRPGAKMVMALNGRMHGALSGGCLEGDLFIYAEQAMNTGVPTVRDYDLAEDEMWSLGIGCKGHVEIWVEPVDFTESFWQELLEKVRREEAFSWGGQLPQGQRYFATNAGEWRTRGHGGMPPFTPLEAEALASAGVKDGYWWDVMRPPQRLIVAGAGHDARPVASLARQAGFDVVVLDARDHVNNEEQFPGVRHLVRDASEVDPEELSKSFWVIMNHHQRRDEEAMMVAAHSAPRFIGMLGPLSRTRDMIAKTGVAVSQLPLYSPVGLDIGAENPDEIAISIVSQLMAARNESLGGPLDGKERIHR